MSLSSHHESPCIYLPGIVALPSDSAGCFAFCPWVSRNVIVWATVFARLQPMFTAMVYWHKYFSEPRILSFRLRLKSQFFTAS